MTLYLRVGRFTNVNEGETATHTFNLVITETSKRSIKESKIVHSSEPTFEEDIFQFEIAAKDRSELYIQLIYQDSKTKMLVAGLKIPTKAIPNNKTIHCTLPIINYQLSSQPKMNISLHLDTFNKGQFTAPNGILHRQIILDSIKKQQMMRLVGTNEINVDAILGIDEDEDSESINELPKPPEPKEDPKQEPEARPEPVFVPQNSPLPPLPDIPTSPLIPTPQPLPPVPNVPPIEPTNSTPSLPDLPAAVPPVMTSVNPPLNAPFKTPSSSFQSNSHSYDTVPDIRIVHKNSGQNINLPPIPSEKQTHNFPNQMNQPPSVKLPTLLHLGVGDQNVSALPELGTPTAPPPVAPLNDSVYISSPPQFNTCLPMTQRGGYISTLPRKDNTMKSTSPPPDLPDISFITGPTTLGPSNNSNSVFGQPLTKNGSDESLAVFGSRRGLNTIDQIREKRRQEEIKRQEEKRKQEEQKRKAEEKRLFELRRMQEEEEAKIEALRKQREEEERRQKLEEARKIEEQRLEAERNRQRLEELKQQEAEQRRREQELQKIREEEEQAELLHQQQAAAEFLSNNPYMSQRGPMMPPLIQPVLPQTQQYDQRLIYVQYLLSQGYAQDYINSYMANYPQQFNQYALEYLKNAGYN